jgi:signal transduction histidine kinase
MAVAVAWKQRLAVALVAAVGIIATVGVLAYAAADQHGNTNSSAQFAIGVSGVLVGGYVAYRRTDHALGWILLAAGAFSIAPFFGAAVIDWMIRHTHWDSAARITLALTVWGWIVTRGAFVALVPLALPAGIPRNRWARLEFWATIVAIALTCLAHAKLWTVDHFMGKPPKGLAKFSESFLPWGHRSLYFLGMFALVGMVVRIARLPRPELRRYLPFAIGVGVLSVPTVNSMYQAAFGHDFWHGANTLELWTLPILPLLLAFGVLRHGALDIDVVVRRATVYALLVGLAALAYVAVVSVFSVFVRNGSRTGSAVAAALLVVGLVPVHAALERFVTRRLFGNRDEPYAVIAALGSRLALAPAGDEALRLVADTLREQLRVPYVAVELLGVDTVIEAASSGTPSEHVERFPIAHRGEPLGALVVAPRTAREPFRPRERDLLAAFARQAGVVAHNAALSQAQLQSRALLVETREEERRRIRRDLHDGLGPTLATVSLSLSAAADRLDGDPELAVLLRDLETEVQHAIADIRRLVYDLRPPVLDDLGLVGALRGQAAQLAHGLAIDVEASGVNGELPSAVELAAYRLAVEAMTNVVRHADAAHCVVAIEGGGELVVRVEDDGIGIDPATPRGVGLRSMRERVMELGGSLRIERRAPSGTLVRAAFPLEGLA